VQAGFDHAAHQVRGEAYILTKEEGGRHTPFFTNYRPQFYFRTTDVTGVVTLKEGTEMVMPGDNVEDVGGADRADRDGREAALRHPRRRPHRRRRRGVQDHRVTADIEAIGRQQMAQRIQGVMARAKDNYGYLYNAYPMIEAYMKGWDSGPPDPPG
jgi:hypothetical protein